MAIDLSALFGQQPDYSQFISPAETQRMQSGANQSALLNAAIALLGSSGQTRQPISTGQALGGALGAGLEGYNQSFDRNLKQIVTGMQLGEYKKKQDAQQRLQAAIQGATREVPQFGVVPTETGEMPTPQTLSALTMPIAPKRILDLAKLQEAIIPEAITQDPLKFLEVMGKESKLPPGDLGQFVEAKRLKIIPESMKFEEFKKIGKEPLVQMLPSETSQQTGYGKFGVEENTAIFKAGQTAVKNIGKINETLNLLQKGDATTGIGADLINNVNRTQLLFSDSKKKINQVSDTELLNSLLGADVFPQIGALGIGAKGLDTPAEREFLRQVMTGTIAMNKDTLVRLTNLRKKYEEKALTDYNKAVDEGQLDPLFKFSGLPKKKLSAPATTITVDF